MKVYATLYPFQSQIFEVIKKKDETTTKLKRIEKAWGLQFFYENKTQEVFSWGEPTPKILKMWNFAFFYHFFSCQHWHPRERQALALHCSGRNVKNRYCHPRLIYFNRKKVCRIQISQQLLILLHGNFCQFYLSVVSACSYFLYFSNFRIFLLY